MKNENIMELYVIKDKIADEIGPVFEAKNEAVAVRQYKEVMVKSPYPDDFELLRVGYLDKISAELIPETVIIKVSSPDMSEIHKREMENREKMLNLAIAGEKNEQ